VFDRRRSLEPGARRLPVFTGTIQTDAYEVYQALTRRTPTLTRLGCLAHVRRLYYAALAEAQADAVWCISEIRRLYQIEAEARTLGPSARHALRQARAPAIWAALQGRVLAQSLLGKAVAYFLHEFEALTGYLADGRFEIDNSRTPVREALMTLTREGLVEVVPRSQTRVIFAAGKRRRMSVR
jgi:transposase